MELLGLSSLSMNSLQGGGTVTSSLNAGQLSECWETYREIHSTPPDHDKHTHTEKKTPKSPTSARPLWLTPSPSPNQWPCRAKKHYDQRQYSAAAPNLQRPLVNLLAPRRKQAGGRSSSRGTRPSGRRSGQRFQKQKVIVAFE